MNKELAEFIDTKTDVHSRSFYIPIPTCSSASTVHEFHTHQAVAALHAIGEVYKNHVIILGLKVGTLDRCKVGNA